MVSTSRKKNKGKERKAKKVEAERAERSRIYDDWLGWATGEDKVMGKNIQCKHGCGCILPNDFDHPVSSFIHAFFTYRDANDTTAYTPIEMMHYTLRTHGQVWNNESYKDMLVNILTRIGTNMLLMKLMETVLNKDKGKLWAIRIAKTITVLENYDGGSLEIVMHSRKVQTKLRDFGVFASSGNSRDILKFFSKRVSCSCLKEMYREARRTEQKTGLCFGCGIEKKRVDLSVCSRCMITQYCSRECQVAHWSKHERGCEIFAYAHQHQRN